MKKLPDKTSDDALYSVRLGNSKKVTKSFQPHDFKVRCGENKKGKIKKKKRRIFMKKGLEKMAERFKAGQSYVLQAARVVLATCTANLQIIQEVRLFYNFKLQIINKIENA